MIYWFCLGLFIFASCIITASKREEQLKTEIKQLKEEIKRLKS